MGSHGSEAPLSATLSPDEFRKYLQLVAELHGYASQIISWVNKNVLSVMGGSEVQKGSASFIKWPKEVQDVVIAGLRSEQFAKAYYVQNAYALFVKDFLGLYLEDPNLYVEKLMFEGDVSSINILFEKTLFLRFVEEIHRITSFILRKASDQGLGIEPFKPRELRIEEAVEDLLQKAYEVSVGVNRFATVVYGLRKIISSYMKRLYGGIPQQILDYLGLKTILNIRGLELKGFEDYFTKLMLYFHYHVYYATGPIPRQYESRHTFGVVNNVPTPQKFIEDYINKIKDERRRIEVLNHIKQFHELTTLGGAICALNEVIWRYIKQLKDVLSKWFKDFIDLESEYVKETWKTLNSSGWETPEYLKIFGVNDFTSLNINGKLQSTAWGYVYDSSGAISKRIAFATYEPEVMEYNISIPFQRVLYELMPAIMLGVIDLTLKARMCKNVLYYNGKGYYFAGLPEKPLEYDELNAFTLLIRGEGFKS